MLIYGGSALVLVGLTCIITVSYLGSHRKDAERHYIVTVDAGSSHSEFQLYSWIPTKVNVTAKIQVEPIISQESLACEVKPGISSYNLDPLAAAKSLEGCLAAAVDAVPADRLSSTPVLLRATAGMRVLNANNQSQATAILKAVRDSFLTAGFSDDSSAEILPGRLEGAYGWITVNYANHSIGFDRDRHAGLATAGALDMGGASTQISFQVNKDTKIQPDDRFAMTLFGLDDVVYTHSYLCFGANEIASRYSLSQLAANTTTSPCLPRQASEVYTIADLSELRASFCTKDIDVPSTSPGVLNGTSDADACMQAIGSVISTSSVPLGYGQPALTDTLDFFAFSGYYHVVDYMCSFIDEEGTCTKGLDGSSWNISPQTLLDLGRQTCSMTLEELYLASKQSVPRKYLQVYCMQASYFYSILTKGYGMANTSDALHFVDTVNEQDMGWTLGAVLSETTLENGSKPPFKAQPPAVAAGVVLGCVALVVGMYLLYVVYRKQNDSLHCLRPQYQQLDP
eukprot:TRINITY_DN4691_c0_g1_i1.p1 TRINITY_DN4691_c0_g1~~TRINITY_DN4691_c0_g1_i1.p1  ORF type:complete len:512 (+),score=85.42 TRINITY_DN4691_c0_g1_i1:127-1662(+)